MSGRVDKKVFGTTQSSEAIAYVLERIVPLQVSLLLRNYNILELLFFLSLFAFH